MKINPFALQKPDPGLVEIRYTTGGRMVSNL